MLFKTDENLPPETATVLREAGYDALTVWDQRLRGSRDATVIETCCKENRALITLDMGFADIRQYPPEQYPGLIVLRPSSQSRNHVLATLEGLKPLLQRESVAGNLWIVSEKGVRIHGKDV